VDPSTIALLEAMVHGFIATDGAFDPTLLAPLVGLGYHTSWHDSSAASPMPAGARPRGSIRDVAIDREAGMARLPAGTAIDAGGIGKGLTADLVVSAVLAAGAAGAMVSVGGDLCVSGEGPSDGAWQIAVADPFRDGVEAAHLRLDDGGVATSGTTQRAWRSPDGSPVHHLLDPFAADGPAPLPQAPGDVVQGTVVAGSAMWAEVFAKTLMVHGAARGLARLDELGLGGRAVTLDGAGGTVFSNAAWGRYEAMEDVAGSTHPAGGPDP
jgi:thiamine biosynthesis lipoprotein